MGQRVTVEPATFTLVDFDAAELAAVVEGLLDQLGLDGPVTVEVDERKSAEGAEWLEKIEEENAGEMTPERIAALDQQIKASREALEMLQGAAADAAKAFGENKDVPPANIELLKKHEQTYNDAFGIKPQ